MQLFLFVAALLGSTAVAQVSTIVNRQCYTRYSLRRTATIRTTNFATTTRRTAVVAVTSTPVRTITPLAATSSVTTTRTVFSTTTLPTRTNTYTTSITMTTTKTETEIESYTQTVTTSSTTTVQSTTTVPAPAGFTNLANMPGYFAKRNAVVEKREAAKRDEVKGLIPVIPAADSQPSAPALLVRQAAGNGAQYPVAVSCTATSTIITTRLTTFTAATSTTTAPTLTAFVTRTETFISTRTAIPADATRFVTVSTDTVTSTSTSTTSTIEIKTSTFTVNVASATFLAQCENNNIVGSAVGQKIGTISFNKAFTLQSLYVKDTTGYGCCAQCATSANCAGYAQAPNAGACYYITTDGRCDVGQSFGDRFHYYNTNGDGYRVGNGQCGFLGPQAGIPPQV